MNRLLFSSALMFGASSLLLDSAIKGAAILLLAVIATVLLRRDSAATRHLVWVVAIIAMLVVPVFSAVLPQWQVLPKWAAVSQKSTDFKTERTSPTNNESQVSDVNSSRLSPVTPPEKPNTENWGKEFAEPTFENQFASNEVFPAHTKTLNSDSQENDETTRNSAVASNLQSESNSPIHFWRHCVIGVWMIGFCFLILRLFAARLMLSNSERRATLIGNWNKFGGNRSDVKSKSDNSIFAAFEEGCKRIGVRQRVRLLVHSDRKIPLVWGVFRFRLLLPAAARKWSDEQLRSVLLHELAHIKRRDTIVQVFAQVACALHWFNPLVWFATWRIHTEREGACDDLVLESGVRASAYAEHLLNVATKLTTQRWTSACGLAMAAQSPLESRLHAILNGKRNRRRVTATIGAVALILGTGIAVPVAMLRAATNEKFDQVTTQSSNEPTEELKDEDQDSESNPQKGGIPIKLATEQILKWGEEVNGLRMALAWPPLINEPDLGDDEEFYLVVQNVSKSAIKLRANEAAPNPRRLVFREHGRPIQAFSDKDAEPGNWLIQPRKVVFIQLFKPVKKVEGKMTVSAAIEGDVRLTPRFSMTAEMSIDKSLEGAWTGKLKTGETRGSRDVISPKDNDAKLLFKSWTTAERVDGKIPGGLIGKLGESVKLFITNNPTWKTTPDLNELLPSFDDSHDWVRKDAVKLLDRLTAIQSSPIRMALETENASIIRTGGPLPKMFADAPWGEALENGLRHAWLLDPNSAKYPIGTPLKARVLIHNSGKSPVVFQTRNWHQLQHYATDGNGDKLVSESTRWLTRGQFITYRLGPGEFVELFGAGIGVGPKGDAEGWQQARVGTWIQTKAGDEVTVSTTPLPLHDWNAKPIKGNETRWWQDHIATRLSRHLPFPSDKDARHRLLHRVAIEVLGTSVSMDMNAAFAEDDGPNALESLANRLAKRPGLVPFLGSLQSAATKFTVLPPDPDAAKKPRTATGPGRHTLGENIRLVVTRTPKGNSVANAGSVTYFPPGKKNIPHDLKLPYGYATWAAAWVRGESVMWISQKGLVRKIDFTDPSKVSETRFAGDQAVDAPIPADIRESLRAALAKLESPSQDPEPAAASAADEKANDNDAKKASKQTAATQKIEPDWLLGFWKGTVDNKAFNLSFHRPPAESHIYTDLYIGRATIGRLMSFEIANNGQMVNLYPRGGRDKSKVYAKLILRDDDTLLLEIKGEDAKLVRTPLTRTKRKKTNVPAQKEARQLFAFWQTSALADGKIPGKLIGDLSDAVRAYVKEYPNYHSSSQLPKMLHRFDDSRDWKPAEVVKLLNDVAYYATNPIESLLPKSDQSESDRSRTESQEPKKKNTKTNEYAYGGFPLDDLKGKGVVWNADQNGLSLGYRISGDQWRILGKDLKVELWVLNSGKEEVKFRSLNRQEEGLRVKLTAMDELTHIATMIPSDRWLFGIEHQLPPGYCVKVNELSLGLKSPTKNMPDGNNLAFSVKPGLYNFQCEVAIPGYSARGRDGKKIVPVAGEWKGELTTRGLNVEVVSADAPPQSTRTKWARIQIRKDGQLSLDRKKMSLAELKSNATKNKTNRFVIDADENVPYAKVVEVLSTLQAAGGKSISFKNARMGDSKYRVANLQGSFDFDGERRLSICRPSKHQHFFTVGWPASESWPASRLKTYPNVRGDAPDNWAVIWEPGTDVLWWVDETTIGKMTVTDPARVIVATEGRTNNFSRDFGLPEGVIAEMTRLGFEVGRTKANGLENVIGGNVASRQILSAEYGAWSVIGTVTDVKGNPIAAVPVRLTTDREFMTVKTDENGKYRAYFSLPLNHLAHWRSITVEPILEGFTERNLSKVGEFHLLLHKGEIPRKTQIAGNKNFKPGPIPRISDRNLVASRIGVSPGNPGKADFVVLKGSEVTGEIVDSEGNAIPAHWIAASTPKHRPGYNLAIIKSDTDGRFRLKGIPANQPVIFTVNPDQKPSDTTKSPEVKFGRIGTHKIKIILPKSGSGKNGLSVERQ